MTSLALGPFPEAIGHDEARQMDARDPLARFRGRYVIDEPDLIYLDGNSLGRMPKEAMAILNRVAGHGWGGRLIRSWNEGWWELQVDLGDRLAPILGASPGEVIISDSTSVNLYKLALAAARSRSGRAKIVTDDMNFPTDLYVLKGVADAVGGELVVVESGGSDDPLQALEPAIDERTSLVSLSHTSFKTGYTYDLARITAMAHRVDALTLWDLSHAVGAVPIDLNDADVDLAVGCTYKYLNGGPGSPAFLYVRSDLQTGLDNPIPGWWGHADPFAFDLDFKPVAGIRKFHTGTMPIISLATISAGISDVTEAGMPQIRDKSVALGDFLIDQFDVHLARLGFDLASPRTSNLRGSHISLSHPDAWSIDRALIEMGKVIPDYRAPDNLRLGLSPLYTTFIEVHTAVQRIKSIVEGGHHLAYGGARLTVT